MPTLQAPLAAPIVGESPARPLWQVFFQRLAALVSGLPAYHQAPWTPADTSGAGLAFTAPSGFVVQHGAQVIAQGQVTYPTTVNAAAARIGGLPVPATHAGGGVILATSVGSPILLALAAGETSLQVTTVGGVPYTNGQLSTQTIQFLAIYAAA